MLGLRHVIAVVNCVVLEVTHFGLMALLSVDTFANGARELNTWVLLQGRHIRNGLMGHS